MTFRAVRFIPALLLAAQLTPQKPAADFPGLKDPALFTRMPNFYLLRKDSVVEKPFDAYEFPVTVAGKNSRQRVEGHYWSYIYRFDESAGPIPSPLQTVRNYQAAGVKIGGKVMSDAREGRNITLMIARGGKETWVYVEPYYGGKEYHLTLVEREAMQQDVAANAGALREGLTQTGHAEVSGIFFDFGKAEVKPNPKRR